MAASGNEMGWRRQWLWVFGGAILGMVIAVLFAGVLKLERNLFLVPYSLLITAYLYGYVRYSGLDLKEMFSRYWGRGLLGGAVVGLFVVQSVLRQPSSPTPQGMDLLLNLLWPGVIYGAIDGFLLSVLPVYAVLEASSALGWTSTWPKRIGANTLALVVSLMVVAIYHLGYPEFQNKQVLLPVFGVGLMSLAYIVTKNPIAPVLSHVAMHIAAVIHGLNSVVQLPPHY
ncbi:MAG: hypothetical protein M0009_11275 [Deltaproteobacteria bacterium]|nr:hypothetical protein [Deltaproteobacteria bacterium]